LIETKWPGRGTCESCKHAPFVCEFCGRAGRSPDAHPRRFCDKACAGKATWIGKGQPTGREHWNWRGGADYYRGPGWRHIRDRIRARDRWRCRDCGEDRRGKVLHVHHLIRAEEWDRPGEANLDENLISLCPRCHSIREQGMDADPKARRARAWQSWYARNREARAVKRRAQREAAKPHC